MKTYIFKTLIHEALSFITKEYRRHHPSIDAKGTRVQVVELDDPDVLRSAELPVDSELSKKQILQLFLERLQPPFRDAVDAYGLYDDYAEAAAALNIGVGTLKSQLLRARAAFKVWGNELRSSASNIHLISIVPKKGNKTQKKRNIAKISA